MRALAVFLLALGTAVGEPSSGKFDELDFVAKIRDAHTKLSETKAALEAAVEAEEYTEAAAFKAQMTKLSEDLQELKKLRRVSEIPLPDADEMEAVADAVWDAGIAQRLEPLETALASCLAIVQQSVEIAASVGIKEVYVYHASSAVVSHSSRQRQRHAVAEHGAAAPLPHEATPTTTLTTHPTKPGRWSCSDAAFATNGLDYDTHWTDRCDLDDAVPNRDGYIVYIPDHCIIPVASGLEDDHFKTLHSAIASGIVLEFAIPEETHSDCTEEEMRQYSAAFDPAILHPYAHLRQVLDEEVGIGHLSYTLMESGYDMFVNGKGALHITFDSDNEQSAWSEAAAQSENFGEFFRRLSDGKDGTGVGIWRGRGGG